LVILLIETFIFDTKLFRKSLASSAEPESAFLPFNSGVSLNASLIFFPSMVVQVSPSFQLLINIGEICFS
tara:strand:+ start:127 stop:336 length:210 start_codon:yes stop_codon:yes gene_type:complete